MIHPGLQRPFRRRPGLLLLVFLLAAAARADAPGKVVQTPTGEVTVAMETIGENAPKEGVARGVVEAPAERVHRALADLAHWEEFMPFLEASDSRRQSDGSVLSRQRMALPFPFGERRFEIRATSRVEETPQGKVWRTVWDYVPGSGDIAGHRGSWTLTALSPGRTLAICRIYTDPGGSAPRWAMDRATAETLPWILHGLRQHVRRSRYD